MLKLTGNVSLEFTGALPPDLSILPNSPTKHHSTWIDPHSAGSVKLKAILSVAEQHLTISGSGEKSCSDSPQRPPGYVCFELPRDTVALKAILGARVYNSYCKSWSATLLFSEISKKHPTLSKLTCATTVLQSDNSTIFSSQSVQRQMFFMTKNGLCIQVDHSIYLDSGKMPGAIFYQSKDELTDAGLKRWGENGAENWFMMASVHKGKKILSTGFGTLIQLGDDPENIINSLSW